MNEGHPLPYEKTYHGVGAVQIPMYSENGRKGEPRASLA